ncbi:hypothetical protein DJ532_15890, partial [Sulfolobus sp. A20-N-F8]
VPSTREEDQGPTFRLETRAGELTSVASLRGLNPEGVGKPNVRNPGNRVRDGICQGLESLV